MMRTIVAALGALALAAGCGPKHSSGPSGAGAADAGTTTASDGGGGGGGAPAVAAPLTRAECEQMIDHVLAIGMAQQRAQKPADYVPTDEQVAEIRARLAAEQLGECLGWPRPVWACTMAATTVDALYHCAEGQP